MSAIIPVVATPSPGTHEYPGQIITDTVHQNIGLIGGNAIAYTNNRSSVFVIQQVIGGILTNNTLFIGTQGVIGTVVHMEAISPGGGFVADIFKPANSFTATVSVPSQSQTYGVVVGVEFTGVGTFIAVNINAALTNTFTVRVTVTHT